jgi:site-specific DNA recombinase
MRFRQATLFWILQNPIYVGEIRHKGCTYKGQHSSIIERSLWEEVQLHIAQHRPKRLAFSDPNDPYLLRGKLYDEKGDRLYPCKTQKSGKAYRYYATKPKKLSSTMPISNQVRFPAIVLEECVVFHVKELMLSRSRMIDFAFVEGGPFSQSLLNFETMKVWQDPLSTVANGVVKSALTRVVVKDNQILIQVSKTALLSSIFGDIPSTSDASKDPEIVTLTKMLMRRNDKNYRFLISNDDTSPLTHPSYMLRIIATARRWTEQILSGQIKNRRALAKETGFDERTVERILQFASLAPEVIEWAITGGHTQSSVWLEFLSRIPLSWCEQESRLRRCRDVS